ncbi:helix-turn-helix domain-containing protein [Arthrobacter sp. ISL-5]|uniref:helix-turn-helix domain-containing protein n=1 Tax=Arthrobacter sp. ISL-5 TaxID=2819111 RepID=UPI001BE77031|nr:transposase family protein [Arthrobacter sp. ISL-5]
MPAPNIHPQETAKAPPRARSTRRLRDALVTAVIGSGRAAAEAASSFGVSWWLVQRALDSAALTLPDVDALAPRMPGFDEHPYRSVRFLRDPATKASKRYRPWMTKPAAGLDVFAWKRVRRLQCALWQETPSYRGGIRSGARSPSPLTRPCGGGKRRRQCRSQLQR